MLSLKVAELVAKQKFTVVTVFLHELFIDVQNVQLWTLTMGNKT